MSSQVSLQVDIGQIPTDALGLLGAAQPLLKALSADDINPLAVIQIQTIGNCFHSNGEWAKCLPDVLSRTSSFRLERLSTWIGWQKGDAGDYLGKTLGGRSAALICLALGNLYGSERCGEVLYSLSASLLPKDCCNVSINHLIGIGAYLSGKLSTLGFGNLLAVHLTRIRQSFFEAGSDVPLNLADMPTQETMVDFLVNLNKALQSDHLVLRFSGTHGADVLLAVVMCLCPEDVRVDVQGELIHQGLRESIVFSICGLDTEAASIRLEYRLQIHSDNFQRQYISTIEQPVWNRLSFTWAGWFSASLSVALVQSGAKSDYSVELAVADLIKTCLYTATSEDFSDVGKFEMPINGIRSWLGPHWQHTITKTLKTILVEPGDSSDHSLVSAYRNLRATIASVLPTRSCSCDLCFTEEPWGLMIAPPKSTSTAHSKWQSCRYAIFWRTLAQLINIGLCSVLVECRGKPSLRPFDWVNGITGSGSAFGCILIGLRRASVLSQSVYGSTHIRFVHAALLSLVAQRYYSEDQLCASSEASTIFPMALQ